MKKEHISLFANLWAKKEPESPRSTPVVITSYSQPHVLQQRMKEEKLSHGDRVKADLNLVRFEANFGKFVMYFCPMQNIEIREEIEIGDGGSLPEEATLHNVNVPVGFKSGLYNIKNVELFSNGTLQVIAGEDTIYEPA